MIKINSSLIDLGVVKEGNTDYSMFEPLKELLKGVEIVMLGEQSHGEASLPLEIPITLINSMRVSDSIERDMTIVKKKLAKVWLEEKQTCV